MWEDIAPSDVEVVDNKLSNVGVYFLDIGHVK